MSDLERFYTFFIKLFSPGYYSSKNIPNIIFIARTIVFGLFVRGLNAFSDIHVNMV